MEFLFNPHDESFTPVKMARLSSFLQKFEMYFLHRQIKMKFFTKTRSIWNRFMTNTIYWFASILLHQDKLILFSSSPKDKYGNISALAQWMSEKKMAFTWVTGGQFTSHPYRTLVSLARARVFVIDASSPSAHIKLHRNTYLIHCWHAGGAYKKVAFDAKRKNYDDAREEKRIHRIHRQIDWFICTSEETARIYANAFRFPLERMLVFGSPRMDASLQRGNFLTPARYTILYAPTYRTYGKNTRYFLPLPDGEVLRAVLASRLGEDVCLAFRGHPTTPVAENFKGWEDWSDIPQHEALHRASVLITDYSSIFFDFLPFKRPIIFYVPDFHEYQCHDRELYFSPYKVFPETTCSDEQALVQLLAQCRHMKADYVAIWEKYMSACDGRSSERVCEFIQNIMKGNIR